TLPGGLVKTHDIEGPIGHAFESHFQLLYGNGYQHEADVFARDWNNPLGMGGNISALPVSSISQSIIDNDNLILFGTADSNPILNQITYDESLPFNLPIEVTDDFINIGGKIYSTADFGIFMIYPNPLNPDKYVVVSEGTFFDSNLGWDLETLPWAWPDYVVFDKNFVYDPATMSDVQGLPYLESIFAEAGYFDNNWRLTVVPEPATCLLLAAGLAGLGYIRRKR
ncbi:MAG TPA: PEP-CTERM sorting domain-containing protein, partial [Planctomycetota bacterium]|nr:PEP-CTERM sorting domain-containing protein [Planctomycetota bacterium]